MFLLVICVPKVLLSSFKQDFPPSSVRTKVHVKETGTGNRELETKTPHRIFVTAPRASCNNTPILKASCQMIHQAI
ncbi:unnamed protein product [Sphagnum balticum]